MNNHYIPQLLLKQFAVLGKVNVYNLATSQFSTQKIRKVFAEENLFDEELEQLFAKKLEGPFGDLLNHKLLKEDTIRLERRENLITREVSTNEVSIQIFVLHRHQAELQSFL